MLSRVMRSNVARGGLIEEFSLNDIYLKSAWSHLICARAFFSCRGATQISQIIRIVKFMLVTAMCEVKLVDMDIIEDFK